MSGKDGETRTRVLNVATRLFAARGFEKVTVREICREANANIAAVNYHFRDKMGLYLEVLGQAIELMKGTLVAAKAGGQGRPPDEKLRIYVEVFLRRVVFQNPDHWIHQLMMHELADPTPALDQVISAVIRPRMEYLGELVGTMLALPPSDERVVRCVPLPGKCGERSGRVARPSPNSRCGGEVLLEAYRDRPMSGELVAQAVSGANDKISVIRGNGGGKRAGNR